MKTQEIDYTIPLPSYKNPKNLLIAEYRSNCVRILNEFLKKHETYFEFWKEDKVGTKFYTGEHFIDFSDVITDLEEDAPKGCIWDYYEYLLQNQSNYMRYSEYIKIYPEIIK